MSSTGFTEAGQERELFGCPIFEAEKALNRDHICNNISEKYMSAVRRHITRTHDRYLRYCATCKRHFIDKDAFEMFHGSKCHGSSDKEESVPLKGRGQTRQYEEVYNLLNNVTSNSQSGSQCKSCGTRRIAQHRLTMKLLLLTMATIAKTQWLRDKALQRGHKESRTHTRSSSIRTPKELTTAPPYFKTSHSSLSAPT